MNSTTSRFTIMPAGQDDVPLVLSLIRELAAYEQLAHEVVATEALLHEALFGLSAVAHAVVARDTDGTPAGFALYFFNFSTFVGRPGLYLEDLFVRPEFRKHSGRPYHRTPLQARRLDHAGSEQAES